MGSTVIVIVKCELWGHRLAFSIDVVEAVLVPQGAEAVGAAGLLGSFKFEEFFWSFSDSILVLTPPPPEVTSSTRQWHKLVVFRCPRLCQVLLESPLCS